MTISIIIFIFWGIVGLVELLLPEKISKFSYGLIWLVLMGQLFENIFEKMNM